MIRTTRLFVATTLGILTGILSVRLINTPLGIPKFFSYFIIINWSVIGFGIGISSLKLPWWLHSILLGSFFPTPMIPVIITTSRYATIWVIVTGALYGLIIELVISVGSKAKSSTG